METTKQYSIEEVANHLQNDGAVENDISNLKLLNKVLRQAFTESTNSFGQFKFYFKDKSAMGLDYNCSDYTGLPTIKLSQIKDESPTPTVESEKQKCSSCFGTGYVVYGGSFGGGSYSERCKSCEFLSSVESSEKESEFVQRHLKGDLALSSNFWDKIRNEYYSECSKMQNQSAPSFIEWAKEKYPVKVEPTPSPKEPVEQGAAERETLEKINLVWLNEAQAIRLLEQYGEWKIEQHQSNTSVMEHALRRIIVLCDNDDFPKVAREIAHEALSTHTPITNKL